MILKQRGIVLITILIFLFIFTLLAISNLSVAQLQLRMSNNLAAHNQDLQAVEAGLVAGEKLLRQSPHNSCIKNYPNTGVSNRPWLVGNSCILSYNPAAIHYAIERLPVEACLITGKGSVNEALLNKGEIYKITAWSQHLDYPKLILQMTYAVATEETCVNPVNALKPGRLSWRELDSS